MDQSGPLETWGNGITATSSAVAAAALDQTATQSNSNSEAFSVEDTPGNTENVEQRQEIEQTNVSSQAGAAIATAVSESVEVRSWQDPSGGNGITATSSAVAPAALTQTATQSNDNSATIELPFVTTITVENQQQAVEQTNLSEQEGAAIATAASDFVKVESGWLEAGGDGITATSSAVAVANLGQTATQSNGNSASVVRVPPQEGQQSTTTVNDVGQAQRVRQANVSEQEGAAIATASSDSVVVNSLYGVSAGGNGITATSAAVAVAALNQSAEQANANEEAATAINFKQGFDITQSNVNDQDGAAIATASSDDVTVDQIGLLSAGGNGITATSSAIAQAELEQTATQSNRNSISAALEQGSSGSAALLLEPEERIIFDGQTNVNEQEGVVIATAEWGKWKS